MSHDHFIIRLLKSYLKQTEIMQYTEHIFSSILERICNYSMIPQKKRKLPNPSSSENAVRPNSSKDNNEILQLNELLPFLDEMFELIIGSLTSMPQSIRILIKIIEICAMETV